ncbi:MAG: hypothetical protein J3K34DRAFT_428875 [Monoraphidium minutum]|nr:MAG: hypothetical protein J3K34DRAFT_428875 [Monoraphidium minutum]
MESLGPSVCEAGMASLSLGAPASPITSGSNATSSGGHVASAPRVSGSAGSGVAARAAHAKDTFGDLLAVMSPMQLVAGDDPVAEAEQWSVFADVFETEVRHQEAAEGAELGLERRRQVLADILVWAEVTQSRYDEGTASFVTEPHEQDASFRRIGDMLKAAQARRGRCG